MNEFNYMFLTLKETLEREPDNVEALEKIWISVEVCRNYEESIDLHLTLIEKKPYNSLAWYNLGHAYNFLGEYEKAIDALEYSFLIDPDFETGYMDCAEVCMQRQEYTKAYDLYREAMLRFGPNEDAISFMIEALMQLQRNREALQLTLQFLEQDPYNDELLFFAAEIYREKKRYNVALNYYDRAISFNRMMETYHLGIAKTYEALGEFDDAAKFYREATSLASEENQYWMAYIQFLLRCNRPFEALNVLDEADHYAVGVELDYMRAICLYRIGLFKEGFALLEELARENPDSIPSVIHLYPSIERNPKIKAMLDYYVQYN